MKGPADGGAFFFTKQNCLRRNPICLGKNNPKGGQHAQK
jgi:hypothetical protein